MPFLSRESERRNEAKLTIEERKNQLEAAMRLLFFLASCLFFAAAGAPEQRECRREATFMLSPHCFFLF